MLALCVEASHARGMGHLFRSSLLARALIEAGHDVKFYVNDHAPSLEWLECQGLSFSVAPVNLPDAVWEQAVIARDGINLWIYDKHNTDVDAAGRIKSSGIALVTFDDRGSGVSEADLHIAGLALDPEEPLGGRKVLRGERYLMLNPELARYRRPRSAGNKYIVSLGGADTYGVTPKVMRMLADAGRHATVILGPAFTHFDLLTEELAGGFDIKRNVKSLAEEFDQHDIAVTGGGMTPFEANACGLPCIVIANEDFEIPVGQALARFGAAVFAGHHSSIDRSAFARDIPVAQMSRAALEHIDLGGLPRVVEAVLSL